MPFSLKPLFRLTLPLTLLLLALLSPGYLNAIRSDYIDLLKLLPYGLLLFVLGLSHYFNRSRFFAAALLMGFSFWLIQHHLQTTLEKPLPLYLFTSMSILLPFGLTLLAGLPEKGLWNRHGALAILAGPLLLVLAYSGSHMSTDTQLLTALQAMPLKPLAGSFLSFYGAIWSGLLLLITLFLLLRRNAELEAACVACIIFSVITLAEFDRPLISSVMFSAAGLTMILALLRSSFEMAYRDDLTGLLSRRALNEKLRGLGNRYVIAMIDIDHFKKFNDTYGHDAGDDVLKIVARHIAETTGGGTPYRYGGEEFCIIFPGKSLKPCIPHIEAVREAIGDHRITLRDQKNRPKTAREGSKKRGGRRQQKAVNVTISAGIAERSELNRTPVAVLKCADKALYKAKQSGRNCLAQ